MTTHKASAVRSTTHFLFHKFQKNFCGKSTLPAGYRCDGGVSAVFKEY